MDERLEHPIDELVDDMAPQALEASPDTPHSESPEVKTVEEATADGEAQANEAISADGTLNVDDVVEDRPIESEDAHLKAILEAIIYITDEPLSAQQIAAAIERPIDVVSRLLNELVADFGQPQHGLAIREIAGGYKMATKAEHHEAVRAFVKKLTPPLKLSLAALETLAVIAYKQPITAPEIMDIRGVQGAGVLKTLLDRKLISEAGRKNVVGKPILYKTTKEFLVQFGLKNLNELPTLKEFEELGRLEIVEPEIVEPEVAEPQIAESPAAEPAPEAEAAAAVEHNETPSETGPADLTENSTKISNEISTTGETPEQA
jgi:segregation and condensation protein B